MASGEVQAGGDDGVLNLQSLLVRRPCDPGRVTLRSHSPGCPHSERPPWLLVGGSPPSCCSPGLPRAPSPSAPSTRALASGRIRVREELGKKRKLRAFVNNPGLCSVYTFPPNAPSSLPQLSPDLSWGPGLLLLMHFLSQTFFP